MPGLGQAQYQQNPQVEPKGVGNDHSRPPHAGRRVRSRCRDSAIRLCRTKLGPHVVEHQGQQRVGQSGRMVGSDHLEAWRILLGWYLEQPFAGQQARRHEGHHAGLPQVLERHEERGHGRPDAASLSLLLESTHRRPSGRDPCARYAASVSLDWRTLPSAAERGSARFDLHGRALGSLAGLLRPSRHREATRRQRQFLAGSVSTRPRQEADFRSVGPTGQGQFTVAFGETRYWP